MGVCRGATGDRRVEATARKRQARAELLLLLLSRWGILRGTTAPQMRGEKPAEERRARWARLPRRRGTEGVDYRIAIVRAGEGCERADPRGARRVAWKGPVSEQLLQHPRRHGAGGRVTSNFRESSGSEVSALHWRGRKHYKFEMTSLHAAPSPPTQVLE